jgi:hypothetical protein
MDIKDLMEWMCQVRMGSQVSLGDKIDGHKNHTMINPVTLSIKHATSATF